MLSLGTNRMTTTQELRVARLGTFRVMGSRLLVLLWVLTFVLPANAGGLYTSEFATPSMGTAGAGSLALGADATSVFHNSATMTRLDSHQLNLGLAPGASNVKFDQSSTTPVTGNNGSNQGGLIPLLGSSYVHKISDRARFGLGIFSISGASLDPKNGWAGRSRICMMRRSGVMPQKTMPASSKASL